LAAATTSGKSEDGEREREPNADERRQSSHT
jgi:hypothetical protein